VAGCLIGAEAARQLGIDSVFYVSALALGCLYVSTRFSEVLWVGFLLLALTAQLYQLQIDELGDSVRGGYRPYILVVVMMGLSFLAGRWLVSRRERTHRSSKCSFVNRRFAFFVGVFFLALCFGYFNHPRPVDLADVLRDCSGFFTFVVFLLIGLWMSPSEGAIQKSFSRLRLATLAYSIFFLVKFFYLSQFFGADETAAGYGYSQRDIIFFCGLTFAALVSQVLTAEARCRWRAIWPAALALLWATLLSGSRSILLCELLVSLILMLCRRSKGKLVLILVGVTVPLIAFLALSLDLPTRSDSGEKLLGYVANRFLVASAEDTSLLARLSQVDAVADALRNHPLLGAGPLAVYSFFDPIGGWKETTFLDSGLGYLLMKTGLLGTAVFFWFAAGWLKMERRLRQLVPTLAVLSLSTFVFYLVFLRGQGIHLGFNLQELLVFSF